MNTPTVEQIEFDDISQNHLADELTKLLGITVKVTEITVYEIIKSNAAYIAKISLNALIRINENVWESGTVFALKVYAPKLNELTSSFGLKNEIEALAKLEKLAYIPEVILTSNTAILMIYVEDLRTLHVELQARTAENPNVAKMLAMLRPVAAELDKIFETVIHCDPSSSNLLVQKKQNLMPLSSQVILLDFGVSVVRGNHYPAPFRLSTEIWPFGEHDKNISLFDFVFKIAIRESILARLQQLALENKDEEYYQLYKSFMSIAWAFFLFNACFKEILPENPVESTAVPIILAEYSFNVEAIDQIKKKFSLNDIQVEALRDACTKIAQKIKQLVEEESILQINIEEIINLLLTAFSENES